MVSRICSYFHCFMNCLTVIPLWYFNVFYTPPVLAYLPFPSNLYAFILPTLCGLWIICAIIFPCPFSLFLFHFVFPLSFVSLYPPAWQTFQLFLPISFIWEFLLWPLPFPSHAQVSLPLFLHVSLKSQMFISLCPQPCCQFLERGKTV